MTYFDAAAAWRARRRATLVVLTGLATLMLAGCESASTYIGGWMDPPVANVATASTTAPAAQPAVAPATALPARIGLMPIMGAPDGVSKQLTDKLVEAVEKHKVGVARDKAAIAEHYVRGYVVAAKDTAGTKLSYIWDVTDKNGSKRLHRIQGEDLLKGPAADDPWTAVDQKAVQALADKTAVKLAQWLSTQPASSAVASVQPAAAVGATPVAQPALATSKGKPIPAAAAPTATASIAKGDATTVVPAVIGAPGDGSTALSAALKRELTKSQVSLADGSGAGSYKVQGRVAMGQPAGGKQSIQIEWVVTDPAGKRLGTVSQKNDVQQGALDGPWGQTADAAASAAAQGILKLLPGRATN